MNKWPLSAIITIVTLFAASVGSFAVTKYQVNDTAKKVEKMCEKDEAEKSAVLSALNDMKLTQEKQNSRMELLIQDVKYLRADVSKLR